MKALSLKQPWLDLIILGHKTIETRTWSTTYRGPLLLCASKTVDWGSHAYFVSAGLIKENAKMVVGHALATCELVDCRPMRKSDEKKAQCPWYKGAVAWIIEDVKAIDPFPVRGQLSIFEVEITDKKEGQHLLF